MKKFATSFVLVMVLVLTSFALVGCDNLDPLKSEGISSEALKPTTDGGDTNCDDNDLCTTDGVDPDSKLCIYEDVNCDDGNVCTTDSCDPNTGCEHDSVVGCCLLDTDCNAGQVCDLIQNVCVGCLADADCNDGNACTTDTCTSNVCGYTAVVCDDGLFCNGAEICNTTTGCVAGTAPETDDGIACTVDACDEGADTVTHIPDNGLCGDSNVCNGSETCDPATGCVAGLPLNCDDGNPCTADSCDPITGCVFTAIIGCCTTDVQCFAIGETSWGYSSPCVVDADCPAPGHLCVEGVMCLPAAYDFGCTTFDDILGNPSNLPGTCEMCADTNGDGECANFESFCQGGLDEDADGLVDCEDDDCDGEVCGANMVCEGGICVDDVECLDDVDCDDTNVCTTDTCVDGACVFTANNNPCDDGDACTTDDECKDGGVCTGGPELDCDDDNVCTADSCDPVDGCMYEDVLECCLTDEECDDGNVCTDGICVAQPTGLCNSTNCIVGNHCEGNLCVVDGYAVWCWDDTLPLEGAPHCHTFTGTTGTYWSPAVWAFADYSAIPPKCGSAPAGITPPPVQYPAPICCVSGAGALGMCQGGAVFHPYQ